MKRKFDYEPIKAKLREGMTPSEIVRLFGCSTSVVISARAEMIGEKNKAENQLLPRSKINGRKPTK